MQYVAHLNLNFLDGISLRRQLKRPDPILVAKGVVMKNSECTIYIMFKDRWLQKFRKEKEGWFQTSSNGTMRLCSAEQLLSHILPPLAGIKGPHVAVKVEPDDRIKKD